jgi:hypothetical protein
VNTNTIGCCGLFCESCDIYQSLQRGTLKALADEWDMKPEDLACDGCRAERRALQSRNCFIRECCLGRNLDSCGECAEFPCATLREHNDSAAPHSSLAIKNCCFFKEAGRFEWYHMQKQRWTCSCGQMFTWYQSQCSRCSKPVVNVLHEEDAVLEETSSEADKELSQEG